VLGNFQKPSPPNWAGNRIGTGNEVKARKFLFSFGGLGYLGATIENNFTSRFASPASADAWVGLSSRKPTRASKLKMS